MEVIIANSFAIVAETIGILMNSDMEIERLHQRAQAENIKTGWIIFLDDKCFFRNFSRLAAY